MFLFEYEGKELFRKYGIPVPNGQLAKSPEEASTIANSLGGKVVVKAQVLAGGRGKAGGVRLANCPEEARSLAAEILGMEIKGEKVGAVLVEQQLEIAEELYLGITMDPVAYKPVLMLSTAGGIDIEEVAQRFPEKVLKWHLDVLRVPRLFELMDLCRHLGLADGRLLQAGKILHSLIKLFFEIDATTVEINPLVGTPKGDLVAADAKVIVDDSAMFRHPELPWSRLDEQLNPLEREAKNAGLAFVLLEKDGNVGIIGGGAGVGLATMDTVAYYGGIPVNFLDTGGGISAERMAEALRIVLKSPGVKGVLINVFGGINNCAVMARGIVNVYEERKGYPVPVVVKMRGHFQEEGWSLLERHGIPLVKHGSTDEAAKLLLKLMGEMGRENNGNIGR